MFYSPVLGRYISCETSPDTSLGRKIGICSTGWIIKTGWLCSINSYLSELFSYTILPWLEATICGGQVERDLSCKGKAIGNVDCRIRVGNFPIRILGPPTHPPLENKQNSNSGACIVQLRMQARGKRKYMRFEIRYFFLEIGLSPSGLPNLKKKYLISNLIIYFHFLTEWWRTHSNVLAPQLT